MKTFQTIIYSTNSNIVHTIKSSLEILPLDYRNDFRFNLIYEDDIRRFKTRLNENVFDIYIIEHDAALSQGLKALENIDEKAKIEPEIMHGAYVIFIGPEHAKTVLKVLKYNFVSGYELRSELDPDRFAEKIIETYIKAEEESRESSAIKKTRQDNQALMDEIFLHLFGNLISVCENLVISGKKNIQLEQSIENLQKEIDSLKLAYEQTSGEEIYFDKAPEKEEGIDENGNKVVISSLLYFLDIRIFINPGIRKVYLRHEIQILVDLIFKFLSAWLNRYSYIKLISNPDRLLCVFPGQEALKCALEIIIKFMKIYYNEDTILKNFKFNMGIDYCKIGKVNNPTEILNQADLKTLDKILSGLKPANTLFITEQTYKKVDKKLKSFFKSVNKPKMKKYYSFYAVYG